MEGTAQCPMEVNNTYKIVVYIDHLQTFVLLVQILVFTPKNKHGPAINGTTARSLTISHLTSPL